jgi:hypothetical protein
MLSVAHGAYCSTSRCVVSVLKTTRPRWNTSSIVTRLPRTSSSRAKAGRTKPGSALSRIFGLPASAKRALSQLFWPSLRPASIELEASITIMMRGKDATQSGAGCAVHSTGGKVGRWCRGRSGKGIRSRVRIPGPPACAAGGVGSSRSCSPGAR